MTEFLSETAQRIEVTLNMWKESSFGRISAPQWLSGSVAQWLSGSVCAALKRFSRGGGECSCVLTRHSTVADAGRPSRCACAWSGVSISTALVRVSSSGRKRLQLICVPYITGRACWLLVWQTTCTVRGNNHS
jgi:hypothetical protein